jgi:hypothetical protein
MFNFMGILIPVSGRATVESVARRKETSQIRTDIFFVATKNSAEKQSVIAA